MNCIEIEKHLDYLLDDENYLAAGSDEIKHHLNDCQNCRQNYETLRAVNETLNKLIVPPDPVCLDAQVMGAFRRRHQKNPAEKKEAMRRRFWDFGWTPKFAAALAGAVFLFIISMGAAFQLGRLTAANIQVSLPQTERIIQITAPEKADAVNAGAVKSVSEINAAVAPVTKFVKVPVVREKIVTRIVYTKKSSEKARFWQESVIAASTENSPALKSSTRKNEFLTEANLKGFQLVANSKIKIIKKGETDEN